jgi:tetratricopeptide (TPR) repeat protein
MRKSSFLTGLFLLFGFAIFANQAEELFRQGNEAFQKNDFEKAAKLYEQVLDSGYRSLELEYNLGNTFYRLNKPGKAILHYERALVLSPNDADVQHNLEIARQQVKGEIEALPEFFLTHWWRSLRNVAESGVWGVVALLLWWAGLAGLVFWLLGKTRKQKKMGFVAGLICLMVSFLPYSLAMSRVKYEADTNFAILLEPTATLRSAPDESGSDLMQLYEGTKVKLQDQLGGWWQVKLANGEVGWLKNDVLEEI